MKIRVAILEYDQNYRERLVSILETKYADKLDLYIFSGEEQLCEHLNENVVDVILADGENSLEETIGSFHVMLAYLTNSMNIAELFGRPTICKYQKADSIYRQILALYAETAPDLKMKTGDGKAKLVAFVSAQGGVGTSTVAAAYARRLASLHRKVFYLNLEAFGDTSLYFEAEGTASFSDVIFTLKKGRKNNFLLKLESAVKTEASGVEFFSSCPNACDMQELKTDNIGLLLEGISQMKDYDEIVVDLSGEYSSRMLFVMKACADRIVCVADGKAPGMKKLNRFCEVLSVEEKNSKTDILGKMLLLYNRINTKQESSFQQPLSVIGKIPEKEAPTQKALLDKLSEMTILERI